MTFKDKIKHMLHKKSPSTSGASHIDVSGSTSNGKESTTSPTKSSSKSIPSPASPKPKHGPNNPPNARDPGFRKSFNLGENDREKSEDAESNNDNTSSGSPPQSIPTNTTSPNGKQLMLTLDKYGDDYLGVSPRTHATIPERNLSSVSSIGQDGLGVLPEKSGHQGIQSLEGRLSDANEHPQPAVTKSVLESRLPLPPASPPTIELSASSPKNSTGVNETASSIYSEDPLQRPSLHKDSSSIYTTTPVTSPPPTSSVPRPSAHQLQYTSLVSDITNEDPLKPLNPAAEPLAKEQEPSRWQSTPPGGEFLAAVQTNFPDTGTPFAESLEKSLAAAALRDPNASEDKQAEAFADIIGAHVQLRAGEKDEQNVDRQAEAFADIVAASIQSMKAGMQNLSTADGPDTVQAGTSGSDIAATPRPALVPADSVLEITRGIPGSFSA